MMNPSGFDVSAFAEPAFGSVLTAWPLPVAKTPDDRWLRAVALGGRGCYGAAHADLDSLIRRDAGGSGRLVSLALSTKASLYRQLGWHAQARGVDGLAFARAEGDPDATVDALVGLAADALGLARFSLAEALLERASPFVDSGDGRWPWRLPLRTAWVRAELAMVAGAGEQSLRHARTAQRLAATVPSCRHRVKTAMVLAAALCSAGELDESAEVARSALTAATENGLTPLRWALAAMLTGLPPTSGGGQPPDVLEAIRRECAIAIVRAGGRWRTEAIDKFNCDRELSLLSL
jgi:hypothetical protein